MKDNQNIFNIRDKSSDRNSWGIHLQSISSQDKQPHKAGYQFIKLTSFFLLCIHMKVVSQVDSDQPQTSCVRYCEIWYQSNTK